MTSVVSAVSNSTSSLQGARDQWLLFWCLFAFGRQLGSVIHSSIPPLSALARHPSRIKLGGDPCTDELLRVGIVRHDLHGPEAPMTDRSPAARLGRRQAA